MYGSMPWCCSEYPLPGSPTHPEVCILIARCRSCIWANVLCVLFRNCRGQRSQPGSPAGLEVCMVIAMVIVQVLDLMSCCCSASPALSVGHPWPLLGSLAPPGVDNNPSGPSVSERSIPADGCPSEPPWSSWRPRGGSLHLVPHLRPHSCPLPPPTQETPFKSSLRLVPSRFASLAFP